MWMMMTNSCLHRVLRSIFFLVFVDSLSVPDFFFSKYGMWLNVLFYDKMRASSTVNHPFLVIVTGSETRTGFG